MTDEQIETLAVKHESFGFGQVDAKGLTIHGFDPDGLSAFVTELLASRDAEVAWVRDVLASQGYDGPLAPGCCPLEDWLKERDQLREQVKMLEKEREYFREQATMFRDVAKGVTQQLMVQQILVEAVAAMEQKEQGK